MKLDGAPLSVEETSVFPQRREISRNNRLGLCTLSLRTASRVTFRYNGKSVTYEPPVLCLVPSGLTYTRINDQSEDIPCIHFRFMGETPTEILAVSPAEVTAVRQTFDTALSRWRKRLPGYRSHTAAAVYELLAALEESGSVPTAEPLAYVREAADRMQRQFGEADFTVEKLATALSVCPSQLRKQFSAAYGVPPKQYLQRLRMEHACSLLHLFSLPHAVLAEQCGYRDVKYFRTAFRRSIGCSISEYRRRGLAQTEEANTPPR